MPRWGMVIDLDRCNGCQACETACRSENNIPMGGPVAAKENRTISWLNVLTEPHGEWPNVELRYIPRMCFQCDNPPCVKVCPTGATMLDDEGIVGQVYPRCIGCRYCSNACPYTAKAFNWFEPEYPESTCIGLNPDVSVRPVGVVEKCTFCHHRLQRAREQADVEGRRLREEDYIPACVESCPTRAMTFGDLDNPQHRVHELSRSSGAERLLEDLGTEPKVFFLGGGLPK